MPTNYIQENLKPTPRRFFAPYLTRHSHPRISTTAVLHQRHPVFAAAHLDLGRLVADMNVIPAGVDMNEMGMKRTSDEEWINEHALALVAEQKREAEEHQTLAEGQAQSGFNDDSNNHNDKEDNARSQHNTEAQHDSVSGSEGNHSNNEIG
ncbi:hypothetical protein ACMFMF_001862 [Clarireedia jacksonii]